MKLTVIKITLCLVCLKLLVEVVVCLEDGEYQMQALDDADYKFNIGEGFLFFEIVEPEQLSYTYKLNPGTFGPKWVQFPLSYSSYFSFI